MVSFVDEHRDVWPVAVMCRTIGLSERTFHAAKARPPSVRSLTDAATGVMDQICPWSSASEVAGFCLARNFFSVCGALDLAAGTANSSRTMCGTVRRCL